MNHLQAFFPQGVSFKALTPEKLQAFQKYLLKNLSSNSAKSYFGKVKASLNEAIKDRILTTNPAKLVDPIKESKPQRVYLTETELKQLASTPLESKVTRGRLEEIRRAFLFSCFTGVRFSDLKALTWASIQENTIVLTQQKTKEPLQVPLSTSALKLLGEQGDRTGKLFDLSSNEFVNRTLKEWGEKADLTKPLTFHVARHTFATLSLTADTQLYTVSKLLGHSSIATTQIYAQVIDSKKQEAVDRLPDIEI